MSKPVDVKGFGPDAQLELQASVEAAILATQTGGGGTFLTGEVPIPAQTPTQLPATPIDGAVMLRADADFIVYSSAGGTDGFLMYEGDDIKINSVTDLDQIWVQTVKNSPLTLYFAVTG